MTIEVRFGINKDPVSWITHLVGLLAAVVGLVFLIVYSAPDPAKVTSMAIYGGSLVTLFAASAAYHFLDLGERGNNWLRRFDHAAIFFLIAGSYVPTTVHLLSGAWRISFLSVVGGLGLAGMLFKLAWFDCPRWLSTTLYLTLGWLALVAAPWILPRLDSPGLFLLLTGGAVYTLGAFVYWCKWPDPWPRLLGHHEIWHLFVLVGAAAHFFFMWRLVGEPVPAF